MDATHMELDDLKATWQALDRRLQRDHAIRMHELRERGTERIRGRLRPVYLGQLLQMLFGIAMMLLGVLCWTRNLQLTPFLVSGLVVHAYGLLVLLLSVRTLVLLHAIDFGQPVLALQTRLARLRRQYLLGGSIAGMAWWVLWMPVLVVIIGISDPVELAALPPDAFHPAAWVWIGVAVGATALVALLGVYLWACRPGREDLRRRIDDFMTSPALREAQAQAQELAQFEREPE